MKKFKYVLVLLLVLVVVTGCKTKEEKQLIEAFNNTTISQKKIKSYRAKVSVRNDKENINYIVYNNGNKTYTVTIIDEDKSINLEIDKDGKITSYDSSYELKYEVKGTDLFLEKMELKDETLKSSKTKIGDETYTKYEFKITKESLNEILKPFDIKTKKDGDGYALVDKDKHVYIVNYNSGKINVNVSYTRLKLAK